MSYKRIALWLKVSEKEVKVIKERALRKLARNFNHEVFKRKRAERKALAKKAAAEIKGYSSQEIQGFIKREIRKIRELHGGRRRAKPGARPDKAKQGVDSESMAGSGEWRDKL